MNDIAALRDALSNGPAIPWAYRPYEHDDWGFIRGVEKDSIIGPVKPVVALARQAELASERDHDQHRRDKTDPYEPAGRLIVAAVNALGPLCDEVERLRKALEPFAALAREAAKHGEGRRRDSAHAWGFNNCDLTWGDFHEARAALGGHHA